MTKKIKFRAIEREDLQQLRDWRNEMKDNFREYRTLSMENQEAWFNSLLTDRSTMMWIVEADSQMVGVCGWTYINWVHRHAELSIYIGTEFHGNGYGTVTLDEMHRIAFDELGLHRVYLEVYDFNRAKTLYPKAGYKEVGRWRDHHFHEGTFHDAVLMDLLAEEWRAQKQQSEQ